MSDVKDVKKAVTAIFNPLKAVKDTLTPDMPAPPPAPKVAPVADDQEVKKTRQRATARRYQSGRASTILSEGKSSLG